MIEEIYSLCRTNPLYYKFCPPNVTRESIMEDLTALPSNISMEKKYYIGYFESGEMIAVMDLIDGYPKYDIAFIGFFMTHAKWQKRGMGSAIISELSDYLKQNNYSAVRLAWVKGNPQAEHFWLKNGFCIVRETSSSAADHVMLAEKRL